MKWDLRRPCPKCPFRMDRDFGLREGRVREFAESIAGGAAFPCHETTEAQEADEHGEGGGFYPTASSQMCAGAMIACMKSGEPNQLMRIAARMGALDLDKLDMSAPVGSWSELVNGKPDEEDEEECCAVVGPGCLHPAGVLVGGMVLPAEEAEPTAPCTGCGEHVCSGEGCSELIDSSLYCVECAEYEREEATA